MEANPIRSIFFFCLLLLLFCLLLLLKNPRRCCRTSRSSASTHYLPAAMKLGSDAAAPRCRCTLKPLRSGPSISGVHTAGWRWVGGWVAGWLVEAFVCVRVRVREDAGGRSELLANPAPRSARQSQRYPSAALVHHWRSAASVWIPQTRGGGGRERGGEEERRQQQLESYCQPSASQ